MTPTQEIAKLRKDIKLAKLCIEHWVRMEDDPDCGDRPTPNDCAFCREYLRRGACPGCPIHDHSQDCCGETPYFDALDAWDERFERSWLWPPAAQAMIAFLRRIRKNLQAKLRRRT